MKGEIEPEPNGIVGCCESFGGSKAACEAFGSLSPLRRYIAPLIHSGAERRTEQRYRLYQPQRALPRFLLRSEWLEGGGRGQGRSDLSLQPVQRRTGARLIAHRGSSCANNNVGIMNERTSFNSFIICSASAAAQSLLSTGIAIRLNRSGCNDARCEIWSPEFMPHEHNSKQCLGKLHLQEKYTVRLNKHKPVDEEAFRDHFPLLCR